MWVFASVLDDCAVPDLVGKVDIDIGVHGEEAAGFSFDDCFVELDFEYSEDCFSLLVELHALGV